MLNKLAASMFVLSLAAFGCSSSSGTPHDASTGTGGSTDGAHEGGGGTGGTSGDASGDGPSAELAAAMCPAISAQATDGGNATVTEFSPADFCALYIRDCMADTTTTNAALNVQGTCEATYTGWTMIQKQCRSYHLCLADGQTAGSAGRTTHCLHTQGTAPDGGAVPCP